LESCDVKRLILAGKRGREREREKEKNGIWFANAANDEKGGEKRERERENL